MILLSIASIYIGLYSDSDRFWLEAYTIMIILLLKVISAGLFNHYTDEKLVEIKNLSKQRLTHVIRNGNLTTISISELMIGDIISLDEGDIVPANGILVNSTYIGK